MAEIDTSSMHTELFRLVRLIRQKCYPNNLNVISKDENINLECELSRFNKFDEILNKDKYLKLNAQIKLITYDTKNVHITSKINDLNSEKELNIFISKKQIDFRINVGTLKPNQAFMYYTGVAIMFSPSYGATGCSSFSLIPSFTYSEYDPEKGNTFFPTIDVKDMDSEGPITINGYTKDGNIGILTVTYKAYKTIPFEEENIKMNNLETCKNMYKKKDLKAKRTTVNINPIFIANNYIKSDDAYFFKTVDTDRSNGVLHKTQTLQIQPKPKQKIIFSSRNREWFDKSLLSSAGILDEHEFLVPNFSCLKNKILSNIFCLSSIEAPVYMDIKVELFFSNNITHLTQFCKFNAGIGAFIEFRNLKNEINEILEAIRMNKIPNSAMGFASKKIARICEKFDKVNNIKRAISDPIDGEIDAKQQKNI